MSFYQDMSPDDILELNRPTEGFLCPLSANTYGIEFIEFTIYDYETKAILFEVGRDNPPPLDMDIDLNNLDENMYRKIKYEFSEDVLRLPFISTTLVFSVGDQPVEDFRMIERHYFRNQLVKSFDFTFGFCIPGSTNTWDALYALPPLDEDLIKEMIAHPYETQSDSFYFVGDKLIMHNKASYKYVAEDRAQAKKSYDGRGSKAAKGAKGAKGAKYDSDEDAPAAKAGAKGAKSSKFVDEDDVWSKETDYY
mmetsp:Transcript_4348/g.5993  ORF Transcript_4348/g.5993 Transcript_4348/m.5993 type:complete len:251 (-) Transcript_4348:263-1015(-)|eukprot:CAMPEP_0117755438 /NCGR_PEP_ID=MMETSP0947-20121206/13454_1 /TAXON_ID=44440 /ORGANISM="Chattonella subsalsa, Strain CCMP2191" /LENGTH=250 /DNA_ID=CAMNT_0005574777 /DNA_START=116 /DNA_END=868 /DNA_ORIENTATION=-